MVSIDQINAFIAVYELQGYSVAAKELNKGRTTDNNSESKKEQK